MRVLYFAWLKARTGLAEETVAPPPGIVTVADLIGHLRPRSPGHAEAFANLAVVRWKRHLYDEETRKLLQQIVFKDTRPDWVRWAKDMLVHVPPPGQDIILLPTTRPGT